MQIAALRRVRPPMNTQGPYMQPASPPSLPVNAHSLSSVVFPCARAKQRLPQRSLHPSAESDRTSLTVTPWLVLWLAVKALEPRFATEPSGSEIIRPAQDGAHVRAQQRAHSRSTEGRQVLWVLSDDRLCPFLQHFRQLWWHGNLICRINPLHVHGDACVEGELEMRCGCQRPRRGGAAGARRPGRRSSRHISQRARGLPKQPASCRTATGSLIP